MRRFLGAKLTSTLSITLVLFVLGLMTLGGLVASAASRMLREEFMISITVSDAASEDYGQRLVKRLQRSSYTASAVYVDPESGLKELCDDQKLGMSPEEFLGFNPLPPVVELRLKSDYAVSDSIDVIVHELLVSQKGLIASIDYSDNVLMLLNSTLTRLAIFLAVLAVVFLAICISLIGNTVRLTLHADRFLINTMRLVGATKWFVRRPFIRTHVICGLIAAVIALLALFIVIFMLMGHLSAFDELLRPWPLLVLVCTVFALGIIIPAAAAWYAADRYMGKTIDELYLM